MQNENYDLIIIGSGLGALSLASVMAKHKGKKALVLERHFVIGGFTHTFKRPGGYEWDVGIHYVGDVGKGHQSRALFDYITDGNLDWNMMPDPVEVFSYPDLEFKVRVGKRNYQAALKQTFPAEAAAIDKYFEDVKKAGKWSMSQFMSGALPGVLGSIAGLTGAGARPLALGTTGQYMDAHFKDRRLKAILCSQWGDYGLPPSRSPFAMHASVASHYFKGGFFPAGGSSNIAQSIIPIVERAGGRFIPNCEVTEIIVKGGKAVGVKARRKKSGAYIEEEYRAPVIVSNAGEYNTYVKLLPEQYAARLRKTAAAAPYGDSTFSLYLGLKESPEKLGFKGENHWIYTTFDHEQNFKNPGCLDGDPASCFLSFPSLKNPQAKAHTAEILGGAPYAAFEKWAAQPWMKRDKEYYELKDKISAGLLALVERRHPGFKDLVAYQESSSPLTNEHFTNHPKGGIYGMPSTPERLASLKINAATPVKNLYLTGVDIISPGIVPAMMSGIITAGELCGPFGFFKLMGAIMKETKKG